MLYILPLLRQRIWFEWVRFVIKFIKAFDNFINYDKVIFLDLTILLLTLYLKASFLLIVVLFALRI